MTGPNGFFSHTGMTTVGGTATVAELLETVRRLSSPRPEPVVVLTPSIEALEELGVARAVGGVTPFDRLTGIPVEVTQLVDRPRLVPLAEWHRMKGVGTGLRG